MKISTRLLFDRGSEQMSSVQTKLTQSQAQMAQGKQIINPSDAPDQASTVQRLKSILSRQDSYQTALNTVQNRLQGADMSQWDKYFIQDAWEALVWCEQYGVEVWQ